MAEARAERRLAAILASWPGIRVERIRVRLRLVKLLAQVLENLSSTLESSAARRSSAQRADLFLHGQFVSRQLAGKFSQLTGDKPTRPQKWLNQATRPGVPRAHATSWPKTF